jgi:hypothetical protein
MKFKFKFMFVLVLFSFNCGAGSLTQKDELSTIINSSAYSNLFKYYNDSDQSFLTEYVAAGETHALLNDDKAIYELYSLFSDIQTVRVLPYNVSEDAQAYWQGHPERLKSTFPMEDYKRLWKIAIERENPWKALGVDGSVKLLANAALTGPKFGLDVVSGGFSKIGKGISAGAKAFKKIKIIKNIKKIKTTLSPANLAKITKILKNLDVKAVSKLKLTSADATKIVRFFDSDAYKMFKRAMKAEDIANFLRELTSSDRILINKYIEENSNDETDIISQFYIGLLSDSAVDVSTLLKQTKIGFYIRLFQTGLLSVMAGEDEDVTLALANAAMEVSLKAMEFIPLAGPFVELANANRAALSTIKVSQKKALEAAETFSASRVSFIDSEFNIYKLMVLEGIIQRIQNNNVYIEDSLDLDEYFGVVPSINNIAGATYDIQKIQAINIYEDYYLCRVSHLQNLDVKNTIANVTNQLSLKVNTTCSVKDGNYTAKVRVSRGNNDDKYDLDIEVFISLNEAERKLFKLPTNTSFLDVDPNSFYYPYVKLLAFQNIVNTKTDYFYPNRELTQFQLIVLITNSFYFDKFQAYRKLHSSSDELQLFYAFIAQEVNWTAQITNKDLFVSRNSVADIIYAVFQKEFSLLQFQSHPNNTKLRWLINGEYYSGIIEHSNGWYFSSLFLKATGISKGYKGGGFGSSNHIKRGEAMVFLYKAKQFMEKNK